MRDPIAAAGACDGVEAVVNLAGEPVAQRWTARAKERIRASRVDAPAAFIERAARLVRPPQSYISASAIGYYGSSETATFTEDSPPGDDFLSEVCVAWEQIAERASTAFNARVAFVRTGLVLGNDGGLMAKLLPIFRFGLGGDVASGRQWQSWIHVSDLVGIYIAAIDGLSGPLNGTAPNPVTNREFTRALARALSRPAFLPVPEFALGLIFGEGGATIAQGQRVLPQRTQELGYEFAFARLDDALNDLLKP